METINYYVNPNESKIKSLDEDYYHTMQSSSMAQIDFVEIFLETDVNCPQTCLLNFFYKTILNNLIVMSS